MPIQSANVPEITTLENWPKGMNQQARRGAIDDQEQWWCENLFAMGTGNLRSCWGPSGPIYTAPAGTTILRIFFGFIGWPTPQFAAPGPQYGGRLGWMFLSNGDIDQVDLDTQQVTTIPGAWEDVPPQHWADCVVWRPRFFGSVAGQTGGVLFGSPKGLYAWDGTTLYAPGDDAPDWLTDQAESGVPPTGPTVMPTGLPGIYSMEVYQSRLWVAGKDVLAFSAPNNGADFSATNGGGSVGYLGNVLTYSFMDMKQTAGFLYVYGDSSTHLISNVQLVGSGTLTDPFVTNFNFQNLDPQVGQRYPRWSGRIGRHLQMFNGAGLFEITGGDARPIAQKISNLWETLDDTSFYPTFATATMFGFRVLLANGNFTDTWGRKRSIMLMWHPERGAEFWSVASQHYELTHIGHYEQDSIIRPYGTDGTSLYELFHAPDPTLVKRLSTKALRGSGTARLIEKNFKRLYMEIHDNFGGGVSITGTVSAVTGGMPGGVQDVGFDLTQGVSYSMEPWPLSGGGIAAAIDLQSISPDFTLERLHLAAEERTLYGA